MSQNKFYRLTVRNLSRPQIDAFTTLFPRLVEAGLVQRKGTTALVITLHPQVFRKADRQASAGTQLAASAGYHRNNDPDAWNIKPQTVNALAGKLRNLVAEEV